MPRGRYPKPAHMRQNRTKKSGAATLDETQHGPVPVMPNPDRRRWYALTTTWWAHVWTSPMAGQYLPTDGDSLGRLAILVDAYYHTPSAALLAEIRLQESRFGLSPMDRSRLQWEVRRAEGAEQKRRPTLVAAPRRPGQDDPRKILMGACSKSSF